MGTISSIMSEKTHMSVVICGHVDSGKSTTTGRLLFELGGIPEREMQKLKEEAEKLGKGSFAFAFYMDTQKDERERGVTIKCTTKEFFTDQYHYSIIDAPGHRDFIKNMISGAAQADVAVLMVPADGNFTTAIQKGDHKQGQVQGQTRQHARLINLLGVKQLVVCVNKMDAPETAEYKEARFNEIADEMKSTLIKVGWPKPFVMNRTPILPISGWHGDNLLAQSTNMSWWKGQKVKISKEKAMVVTTLKRPSTTSSSLRSATLRRPCVSPSLVCTRSRVSVMCSLAVLSRALLSLTTRSCSSPPTPRSTLASVRCSLSRCTTRRSTLVCLATTSA